MWHDDIDGVWDDETQRYYYPEYMTGPRGEKVFARVRQEHENIERIQREHLKQKKVDVLPESAMRIARKCDQLKALLIEKNLAYGNSALDPVNVFSDLTAVQQMEGALDHKLSRMMRGHEYRGENTLIDFTGYMVLYIIALEDEAAVKKDGK